MKEQEAAARAALEAQVCVLVRDTCAASHDGQATVTALVLQYQTLAMAGSCAQRLGLITRCGCCAGQC